MEVKTSDMDKDFDFEKNKTVKKYFSRIFTTLSPDIRNKLNDLDIDEQKKKNIKRELAFLSDDKQIEYLNEISKSSKPLKNRKNQL